MAGEITPPTYPTAMALGNIPLSCGVYTASEVRSVAEATANAAVDAVESYIGSTLSTVWKAGGSKSPSQLTSSLLVAENEGKVYNILSCGTTDSNFVEGSGVEYPAGIDIAVINIGTAASPVYAFNLLAASMSIPLASARANGLMSCGAFEKLVGIAAGAEVNQNAFSKIEVCGVTGSGIATSKMDTLTLIPGSGITMSRDGTSVTIDADVSSVDFPVIDVRISGVSILSSGSNCGIANIPVAESGYLGLVRLTDTVSEDYSESGMGNNSGWASTPAAVATRVSKSVLDAYITEVASDTVAPAVISSGSIPNTIYGLISAMKMANDTAD